MADYTEESILITPDKTFKGLQEIRDNFVFAFTIFPKRQKHIEAEKVNRTARGRLHHLGSDYTKNKKIIQY